MISLSLRSSPAFLQGFEKHSVELLDILLIKRIFLLPLEGFDQILRTHFAVAHFQFGEEFLQLEEDAIFTFRMDLLVVCPFIDAVSELRRHEEGLDETVYIASRSNVGKSAISNTSHFESNYNILNSSKPTSA